MSRTAANQRTTKETEIDIALDLDGSGQTDIDTGLPFFSHMLDQLGRHGGFNLKVHATGDLEIDAHHTVEDVGIALVGLPGGMGDKLGVRRFASNVSRSTRPPSRSCSTSRPLPALRGRVSGREDPRRSAVRSAAGRGVRRAFVMASGITLHIVRRRGKNTHHIIEANFKGVARALRDAVRVEGDTRPPPRAPSERGGS